ncbi:hypothetical protein [Phenylobacterium sp.]|uniref:hypothetical protein n=1 Tax=Phenylobacterium sp. TaxID=1871053 RepID=UPI002FC5B102
MKRNHPRAMAFRTLVANVAAAYGGPLSTPLAGVVLSVEADDDLLVASVSAMPADRFNPSFLLDGPAFHRPLLSPLGEATWNALTTLGQGLCAEERKRQVLFALVLLPAVLVQARIDLAVARAA